MRGLERNVVIHKRIRLSGALCLGAALVMGALVVLFETTGQDLLYPSWSTRVEINGEPVDHDAYQRGTLLYIHLDDAIELGEWLAFARDSKLAVVPNRPRRLLCLYYRNEDQQLGVGLRSREKITGYDYQFMRNSVRIAGPGEDIRVSWAAD